MRATKYFPDRPRALPQLAFGRFVQRGAGRIVIDDTLAGSSYGSGRQLQIDGLARYQFANVIAGQVGGKDRCHQGQRAHDTGSEAKYRIHKKTLLLLETIKSTE